jgi:hypothetical protein
LLCLVLTFGWLWADWSDLAARRLPDPDDVMRLVQIRDWLHGQGWRDLTQHRLGPAGVPMHWSRLGDLGPAALILALQPVLGTANAEFAAVVLWPALLFLCFLLLCARIAARLGDPADAPIALIVAALAWPAIWLFMPGRIDHHGLQIVLLLVAVDALLRAASWRSGAALGVAIAASLTLGLEAAPQLAVALAGLVWLWMRDPAGERVRVAGAGGALLAGTALAALAHPAIWPSALCDAFTPPVAGGMAVAGAALFLTAAIPHRLGVPQRLAAFGAIGLVALLALAWLAPACFAGPYAGLPPEMRSLWLDRVEEAQGAFQAPAATAIGYLGAATAGFLAATWFARSERGRWPLLAALIASALLVAFVQLRAAHIAAALAPPALAHLVARARAAGALRRIGGWLVSLGLVYQLAGHAVARETPAQAGPAGCDFDPALAAVRFLPPGFVLAPIDLGPRILAETHHRVLAAPYHRNAAGNLPALRHQFGLAPDPRVSGADYLLGCDGVEILNRPERR